MPAVGPRLRAEREKRDLRLVDVAMATKVGAHHLSALEYDDLDALPDDRSVLEFVRLYAEHLGLDAGATVAEYARELEAGRPAGTATAEAHLEAEARHEDDPAREHAEPDLPRVPDAGRPRIGARHLLAAAALVVVLALVGWWWIAGGAATATPVSPAGPEVARSEETPEARDPAGVGAEARIAAAPVESAPAGTATPLASLPDAAAPGLSVPEHGVGSAVVDRRLIGEAGRFVEGQQVWYWTRVSGGAVGQTIRHVWIHEGRETAGIPLALGGPHWRTQSRKILPPGMTGRWAVEARDEAGRVLARSEFVCAPRR